MKILVLGTGPVGREICAELICQGHKVCSVDSTQPNTLEGHHHHHQVDVWQFIKENMAIIRNKNLIINALPGSISYEVLQKLIPLGVPIVDISFMEEDTSTLDELAKFYNTTVVYDCGIAPGLCNIILGHHLNQGPIDGYVCWVGGFPKNPKEPYNHKTLFSIRDLLSEYTRPARYKFKYDIKTNNPLDILYPYADNQYLEAFISDGLRSLLKLPVSHMEELTLRHKGHIETMQILRDGGFLKPENIESTIKVLEKEWQMNPDEEDAFTMRILVERTGDTPIHYRIFDEYKDGVTAMARTTAYSCVAVVNAFATWGFNIPYGVMSPEEFIMNTEGDEAFKWIMNYIKSKDITILTEGL